jgi:hypothetical protein
MQSSTVNGNLKTEGDLILDSGKCIIRGDCVIDGSLNTCMLGTTYSQTTYHEFGSGTGNKLVIGAPTGAWDRTEQAVILFNSYVYGTLITDYKVVFTDDATVTQDATNMNAHCRKSYINSLYVKANYQRLSTDGNGLYIRMYGSTINNLYIVDNSGNRYDTVIDNAYINNIYGNNLNLNAVYQAVGGIYNGAFVRFYDTTSVMARLMGSIFSTGKIQIDGNTHFGDGSNTANLYAGNGFSTGAVTVTTNTRNMNVYAGGTITLAGPVGNLYLASNASATTVNATYAGTNAIGGSLISESTNAITIASGAIITGSVDSKGVITTAGSIGGTLTTTSTVTVNGGTIGTTSADQLYCKGLTDNGGATINANIYNDTANALTLRSALNGSIYTKGNLTIAALSGDAIEGNVRADGTGETAIKRSVTGSIQTSGGLNMYDGAATGLTVGGNVKATYALFYSVTVFGNVQSSGKNASNYSVQLESGAHIRGATYSSSDGTIRLGGNCTLGAAISGQDVVYSSGQVNFSAWNTAYGDVHCASFYSYNTGWEGSGNHINGTLEADSVYINHVSSTYNAGSSSYNGIYCYGNVDISGLASNGSIGFVRGSGSINIKNYSVSGEVFGPANITLDNTSTGKVYACDPSAPSVLGCVKLIGTSPVGSDVWSLGTGFESEQFHLR